MLFRPSFCANCGERIERAEWYPWTSRRFCQVCESEFKGQDLIPRFVVGVALVASIAGFSTYFKGGSSAEISAVRQPQRFVEKQASAPPAKGPAEPRAVEQVPPPAINAQNPPLQTTSSPITPPAQAPAPRPKVEQSDPVYYCGAETKKGTPCSRRVKGNTRCYQHEGMPSMLTAEKLRIK